jgi:hypothetical protein
MKILNLRKKIIINFSASGILLLISCAVVGYAFHEKNGVNSAVSKIKSETAEFKNQAVEVESKATETKKYKELWKKVTANKKNTNGIKMDDINAMMATVAEKHSIINPEIRVVLPELIKEGALKRSTVNVLFTTVGLTFNAANDVRALSFISEFIGSLPGYPIITSLEIRKNKSYNAQDLVSISSGKGSGSVSGKVDFNWYVYKQKEAEKKDEVKSKEATDDKKSDLKDVKKEVPSEKNPEL